VNSVPKPSKSRFDLEALEPRVLLSSDAGFAAAVVSQAVVHKQTEMVQQNTPTSQNLSQEQISYQSATNSVGIFEGVASQPLSSQPEIAVASPAPVTSSGATDQGSPVAQGGAASQTILQSRTAAAAIAATTNISPVNPAASPAAPSSSSGTAQQLTDSLTAANGPPSAPVSPQPAQNNTVSSKTTSSQTAVSPVATPNGAPSSSSATDLLGEINTIIGMISSSASSGTFTFSYAAGNGVTQVNALSNISVGGIVSITNVTVSVSATIANSKVTVTGVSFSAASASLTLARQSLSRSMTSSTARSGSPSEQLAGR